MNQTDGLPALDAALQRWATRQPEATFIVEAETREELTYGAFAAAVRALRRQLGPEPRAILLALPGGIPAAIVWLAALTGGHRLIPCSPAATDVERRLLAESQDADILVVDEAALATLYSRPSARVYSRSYLSSLAALAGKDGAASMPPAREGSLRLATSGTTGEPKGVVLSAGQIAWTADCVRASHGLSPADRGLCVLPFWHINAPVVSLCATLMAGGCIVIAQRFSVRQFWPWVERERITWASVVPTIIALLNSTQRPATLPGTLRFMRTASAPLPLAYLHAFETRFDVPLVETYGLSEAASQVAANPVLPGRRKPGSVGLPVGVELQVRAQGKADALPPAIEGDIWVRGPSVIAGYEGGADEDSFEDGWFRTGDLGYLDRDGYLYITGRLRDVINRGGEKVAPREIEEVLLAHPLVADAAVAGEPHPLYGQRVVAYIVPHGMWDELAEHHLRDYCAQRLSAYKTPETYYEVVALPRNGNGKLDRRSLARAGMTFTSSLEQRRGVLAHG